MIGAEGHGQRGPSALDLGKESGCHDVLSPRVLGLILLGGMIEGPVTGVDLLADLGVDAIVEGDQEPALGERLRDALSECPPEAFPGDLRGCHEGVEPPLGDMGELEEGMEAPEHIGGLRRGEGDDDGQEGVDEPEAAFFVLFGLGEKIFFELLEEVV